MKIFPGLLYLFMFTFLQPGLQNSSNVLNQKVTVEIINQPVSVLLKQISKQVHFDFSYNSHIIDKKELFTGSFKEKTVLEIISQLFDNKIKCKVKGNYIILYKNTEAPVAVSAQKKNRVEIKKENPVRENNIKDTLTLFEPVTKNIDTINFFNSTPIRHSPENNSLVNSDSVTLPLPQLMLINNDSVLLMEETDTLDLR